MPVFWIDKITQEGIDIKILIADDDNDVLAILFKKLASEGYDVIEARTGQEALQKTSEESPDLILMDVSMPDMDGAEAARRIRGRHRTNHIPIIFLTGILTKKDGEESSNQIHIDGLSYPSLPKPFTFTELTQKIQESLG